jgi:hypothetical protein
MKYLHNELDNEMATSFRQLFPNEHKNAYNYNKEYLIHVNIHNERSRLKERNLEHEIA